MKPIRNLLSVLALFLLSLGIGWMAADEEQRREFLVLLGLVRDTPEPQQAKTSVLPRPIQSVEIQPPRWIFQHPRVSACGPRKATNVAQIADRAVYRWKDGQGQIHFSDRPPGDAEAELVEKDPSVSLDRFDLSIKFDGMAQIPGFRDQVNSGGQRIYRYFRNELSQGNLPPLQVNLVIAGSKKRFEAYRKTFAPTFRASLVVLSL